MFRQKRSFVKQFAALEEVAGEEDLRTAEAYSLLGTVLNRQANFEEALSYHEKALAIRKEKLGDSHSDVKLSISADSGIIFHF